MCQPAGWHILLNAKTKFITKAQNVAYDDNRKESVYSEKLRAGKRRTYFFDVRQTKGDDYYITLTESTRRYDGDGYERHKIFLYKEDFNRFVDMLQSTVDYVKTDLMPDFDYDQYEKRQEEWERRMAEENGDSTQESQPDVSSSTDDDIAW